MAYIVQRLTLNKRLQLAKEDVIRPVSFGSNWNSVRIAVLIQINGASNWTTQAGYPFLALGMCRGTNPIFAGDTTVDALGWAPGNTGPTWGASAVAWNATYNSFSWVAGGTAFQKIGSSFVASNPQTGSGYTLQMGGMSSPGGTTFLNRTPIYLDITRGFPATPVMNSFTFLCSAPYSTQGVDLDPGTFYDRLQTSTLTNTQTQYNAALTVTGDMLWDSVFFSWFRMTPVVEIVELAVVRFA